MGTGWPKNPRALVGRLRRALTFLRALGVELAFGREGRRHKSGRNPAAQQPPALRLAWHRHRVSPIGFHYHRADITFREGQLIPWAHPSDRRSCRTQGQRFGAPGRCPAHDTRSRSDGSNLLVHAAALHSPLHYLSSPTRAVWPRCRCSPARWSPNRCCPRTASCRSNVSYRILSYWKPHVRTRTGRTCGKNACPE